MAIKRTIKPNKQLAEELAEATGELTKTFGLSEDDRLRFKQTGAGYLYASPKSVNSDGSIFLTIIDGKKSQIGNVRSVTYDRLERRTRGPRGGELWEPVTPFD